jgi:hypothetical protein
MQLAPVSEHSTRLTSSGTTPASLVEAPYPSSDCPGCTWVMVRLGTFRLKMVSSRCPRHSPASGFPTVPWPSRPRFWSVGHLS